MSSRSIKIATRGSALALWQANHVRDALGAIRPEWSVELVIIKTQGDLILDKPLAAIGGKALFVKEIEQALIDRRADVAVHSMKDVPAELAPGLCMAAVSTREDPHDALVSRGDRTLSELAPGARVGTSSLRRQCQLLAVRPDLGISMLRGNVPTRIAKLDAGEFDAVVLAAAGLIRLGHGARISQRLDMCLPAVGQGALGIETRDPGSMPGVSGSPGQLDDTEIMDVVRQAMHDPREAARVSAERAFLAYLGGSCQTPLAAHATYEPSGSPSGELCIQAMCGRPDGSSILRAQRTTTVTSPEDAQALGRLVGQDLLDQGAQAIIDACS